MVSNKVNKYLSQYGERNYAPKIRKIEKSDLREYSNRSKCWPPAEASCSNSIQQSRQEQEEEVKAAIQRGLDQVANGQVISRGSFAHHVEETLEEILDQTYHKPILEEKKMKKQTMKERKHEAKETKAYEKKRRT